MILSLPASSNQKDFITITIDQGGSDVLECCVDGKCPCSNLSLALTHIQDNTEIMITSDIPLHHDAEFENVSSVIITGHNNPTITCDHQGSLVGNYIKQITIIDIVFDKCNGITLNSFTHVNITNSTFQYSADTILKSKLIGLVNIVKANFYCNAGSVQIEVAPVNIIKSNFIGNEADALTIFGNYNQNQTVKSTIIGCKFTNNKGYSVKCIGSGQALSQSEISFCNFINNSNTVLYIEFYGITKLENVLFATILQLFQMELLLEQ